jgi:hypothetical protein
MVQSEPVLSFDTAAFDPAFAVEIGPEFPGDGRWRCPVVRFDRDGGVMSKFDSRWGTPFIVRIRPRSGNDWIAMFAAGGLGTMRGAFATPSPHLLVVVVDGLGYLVDATMPGARAEIVHDQVHQVVPCADPPLVLLVRFIDVVALGPFGVAWATPRLCVDGLEVLNADRRGIVCSCDNLGGTPTLTLDPVSGAQLDGTRLDSFWPPDALA